MSQFNIHRYGSQFVRSDYRYLKDSLHTLVVPLEFLALAAVIAPAGTFLAKSADQIAEITRLGRLLVGSVLLAAATSLPELTVDISAVRQGMPDLAVGDLFGSSLMNLLILAVLDLAHRVSVFPKL